MATALTLPKHEMDQITASWPYGTYATVERDGFNGTVVGWYVTREGHQGLVLQQNGSRVVHVYRESGVCKVGQRPFRPDEASP
jgi:hypothetical protein